MLETCPSGHSDYVRNAGISLILRDISYLATVLSHSCAVRP